MKSFGKAEVRCKIKAQIIYIYLQPTVFNNYTQILMSKKKTLARPRAVPHTTVIFKRL